MKSAKIHITAVVFCLIIGCIFNSSLTNKSLKNDIYVWDITDDGGRENKNFTQKIVASIDENKTYPELEILSPYYGVIYPKDSASPKFTWRDENSRSTKWLIAIGFKDSKKMIYALTDEKTWIPDQAVWELIKANSIEKEATITITGIGDNKSFEITASSSIVISTSSDTVEALVLYKQVPPHFGYAYKHPELSKWRLADISSYKEAQIVLHKLSMCGNCHSFSRDGKVFGMDMDYKDDKGAFVLTSTKEQMELKEDDFITWNSYPNPDNTINMGLFSRVSPNGSYVVSTVHEKNYMAIINDLNFSQLFFTYKGILAIYSRRDEKFMSLPGANNPNYVQTSPAWSPDGKHLVFSRARVNEEFIDTIESAKNSDIDPGSRIEDLNRKYRIQYDLYRIPFNDCKGGTPEPLSGASNNGKSNYCARYSPDGKWIVFNQSETGLLLQPDSQLYIIPAQGGTARKMKCNTDIMNSWHTWSPNSRWLVFASKMNSPFTELFLTHVDENGNDSPPVLLWRLNSKEYAATIPEFTNSKTVNIRSIISLKQ
jgi:hypothetical protein